MWLYPHPWGWLRDSFSPQCWRFKGLHRVRTFLLVGSKAAQGITWSDGRCTRVHLCRGLYFRKPSGFILMTWSSHNPLQALQLGSVPTLSVLAKGINFQHSSFGAQTLTTTQLGCPEARVVPNHVVIGSVLGTMRTLAQSNNYYVLFLFVVYY